MADTYLVMLDNGDTDGPFTVSELRERLHSGRVRSADRLTHVGTRAPCRLIDVIPDAQDISHARPTVSERIRRRTSDRHAVADAAASQRSGGAIPAVPAPAAPQPADYLTATQPRPTTTTARPSAGWAKPWVAVVALAATLAIAWWQLQPAATTGRGGGLPMEFVEGRWKVGPDSTMPGLKNAELTCSLKDLTLRQGDLVRTSGISRVSSDTRRLVVELKPIDPDLGQFLQIYVIPGGLRLVSDSGTATLIRL